jgi:hypothetical protein
MWPISTHLSIPGTVAEVEQQIPALVDISQLQVHLVQLVLLDGLEHWVYERVLLQCVLDGLCLCEYFGIHAGNDL